MGTKVAPKRSEWFDRRLAFHGYSATCLAVLTWVLWQHPMAPDTSAAARLSTTMIDAWLWAFLGYTGSRLADTKLRGQKDG